MRSVSLESIAVNISLIFARIEPQIVSHTRLSLAMILRIYSNPLYTLIPAQYKEDSAPIL